MNVAYHIKDWDECFESNQGRKRYKGALPWVRIPTPNGVAYRRLMRKPDGATIYGCWISLVRVAARMKTRGLLVRDGKPLTASELEDFTDIPADTLQRAIDVLTDKSLEWLLVMRWCAETGFWCADNGFRCADSSFMCAGGAQESAFGAQKNNRKKEREKNGHSVTPEGALPPGPPSKGEDPFASPLVAVAQARVDDIGMHAPTNMKRDVRKRWRIIAETHGHEVANCAIEATALQFGPLYRCNQFEAVFSAAYQADALDLIAEDWPKAGSAKNKPPAEPESRGPAIAGNLTMEDLRGMNLTNEDGYEKAFPA